MTSTRRAAYLLCLGMLAVMGAAFLASAFGFHDVVQLIWLLVLFATGGTAMPIVAACALFVVLHALWPPRDLVLFTTACATAGLLALSGDIPMPYTLAALAIVALVSGFAIRSLWGREWGVAWLAGAAAPAFAYLLCALIFYPVLAQSRLSRLDQEWQDIQGTQRWEKEGPELRRERIQQRDKVAIARAQFRTSVPIASGMLGLMGLILASRLARRSAVSARAAGVGAALCWIQAGIAFMALP